MFPKVIHVQYLGDYKLEIIFSDGTKGVSDWSTRLARAKAGGIFSPLKNTSYFAKVELWEGTIRWPNGADICPELLYEQVAKKASSQPQSAVPFQMPVDKIGQPA